MSDSSRLSARSIEILRALELQIDVPADDVAELTDGGLATARDGRLEITELGRAKLHKISESRRREVNDWLRAGGSAIPNE